MENESEKTSWCGNPYSSFNRPEFQSTHLKFKRPNSKILVSHWYENVSESSNQQTRNRLPLSVSRKITGTSPLLVRAHPPRPITWPTQPKHLQPILFRLPFKFHSRWLSRRFNLYVQHRRWFHAAIHWPFFKNKYTYLDCLREDIFMLKWLYN